jgi:hypothetical protein
MATPLSVRDADAAFTSWQCRRSRGHPSSERYVRIASSGRQHFPLPDGAPQSDFDAIAGRYPVYRMDPS